MLGCDDGEAEGKLLGLEEGPDDGDALGPVEGVKLGLSDGFRVGVVLGSSDGWRLGCDEGDSDGDMLGAALGESEANIVGIDDGWFVATNEGGAFAIGTCDGLSDGEPGLGDIFVGDSLTDVWTVGVSRSDLQLDISSGFCIELNA